MIASILYSGNVIKGGNVGITMAETPNTVVGNIIEENIEGFFLGPILWNHTKVHNIFYHKTGVILTLSTVCSKNGMKC